MPHILAAALLITASLLAPQLHAASPIQATLALPHDKVLPGVPFDLVVTYTNVSDKPVTIGGALATLVVTFANGDTVVMDKPDVNDQWNIGDSSKPVQLAPGESVQQAAGWEDGSIPNWFRYGSFSGPGTYGVALDLRITDKYEQPVGTVRTPAVTLTRIEPVGIDAALWKRIQEISNGAWSDDSFVATKPGSALAAEIIQLHPSSGYYPYVVAFRAFDVHEKGKKHLPALLEAAERFPGSPAYPYLLSAAADCARYAGSVARDEGNVAEATKYFTLAESKYREALATRSVAIRSSSERGLFDVTRGR